jgi:hypothetical protein
MAIVSIDADIKAKWPQGQCSYSPGSAEEMAIIGIDLLVKELGTAGAVAFISQVFEKYPSNHLAQVLVNEAQKGPLQQDLTSSG